MKRTLALRVSVAPRRVVMVLFAVLAMALVPAGVARADVLVSYPGTSVSCADGIGLGVWYQSYSGGPRWARISIKTLSGKTVWRRSVTATTSWRDWRYRGTCGRRYQVTYVVPGGTQRWKVRIRGAPSSVKAHASATCGSHPNQAAGQRAADTRDADGDGVYCEALPCPCAKADSGSGAPKPQPIAAPVARARVTHARITSVIDGDTIRVRELAGKRRYITVRLVGIDTPETRKPGRPVECGGKAATSVTLRFSFSAPSDTDGDGLLDREGGQGKRVTLRTDPTQDTHDRYGRLLAYVTSSSGRSLQTSLLSAGWAKVFVFDRPFQRLPTFRRAEGRARAAHRGAWGRCGGNFHMAT